MTLQPDRCPRALLPLLGLLGLLAPLACGDAGDGTDAASAPSTSAAVSDGPGTDATGGAATQATSGGPGTDASASVGETTTTTGETTGPVLPKLDVGASQDFGDDTDGMPVAPTCDNIDEFTATSVGCEFWGAQVPSNPNALPYGISVGNPSEELTAQIVIEDMRGPGGTLREITSFALAPKSSQVTKINGDGGLLPGQHMLSGTGLNALAAFRVTSNVPVTAMQLFPVGGGPSHVSEASLLLPINALDTAYIGAGWKALSENGGWIAVIATQDATTVTTTEGDVMLDAFDAWLYRSSKDATGFFVGADAPVAVFSGAECTLIPDPPWFACDHLEEQLVPLSSWGNNYVAARHPHRVPELNPEPEEVYWRVIAAVENQTIQLEPAVPGVGDMIELLNVGDFQSFAAAESFTAHSDEPFMLVQYMSGCYNVIKQTPQPNSCNQGPTGDPYMIQMPPVEQWLTALPFLTDTSYPRDYVTIMREAGTAVTLDCLGVVPDDHFTAIPGTAYEYGHVTLDMDGAGGEGNCVDGEQYITAESPVGILVMGLDWATSYGYPGGLNLEGLWVPPQEPPG
ncbi:MAG: IgGFc-binding protein [Myxococcales bacterium]|nr:IgGFc-binding protein [Myxococcales bacterium]